MCEEESDDAEAVAKLLEINDSIYRTIERYKLMRAGNVDGANKIAKGTLGTLTGVGKNAANELSLIDFDPEPAPPSQSSVANDNLLESVPAPPGQSSVEDDLLGLSLDGGPTGMISLGPSTGMGSSSIPSQVPTSISHPAISPPPPIASPNPNYDAFAALTSALPSSKPPTPGPMQQRLPTPSHPPVDPFASLVSTGSRPSTPAHFRHASQPQTQQDSLLRLSQRQAPTVAAVEDDWNFTSSLPEQLDTNTIQVHSSKIAIEFTARRQPGQPLISIQARFSNQTPQAISGIHFQVAVEKSYSLQLRPQSGRNLGPNQRNGIQQEILLNGVPPGKGNSVKVRYKVSYQSDGQPLDEQGDVPSLGIL